MAEPAGLAPLEMAIAGALNQLNLRRKKMKAVLLCPDDDALILVVEDITKEFISTKDITEFISYNADNYFIDFCSFNSILVSDSWEDMGYEQRLLVSYIKDNPSKMFYFCFTMPSEYYDDFEELWAYPNVKTLSRDEWCINDAIERIIKGDKEDD